jgi:ABC-type polysaccharide/polyol phosphate export permease
MAAEPAARWTENRPSSGWGTLGLRELWAYRELAYFLALRDIKARYKQAFFGVAWALVQPVAGVVLFSVVFHKLAGVSTGGMPYAVFALSGYIVWTYFASTLNAAAVSLVSNADLVTKVYFPRIAAPVGALLPGLMSFAPGLVLLAVLMAVLGVAPTLALLALPLSLLWLAAAAFSVGLLVAALNVQYRDIGTVVATLIQLWLFATPIAYPAALVTGGWRWVYALNPMAGVVETFRWCVAGGPAPGAPALVSLASTLAVLIVALLYFSRVERRFADVI